MKFKKRAMARRREKAKRKALKKRGNMRFFYTVLNCDGKNLLACSRLSVCGDEEASKRKS